MTEPKAAAATDGMCTISYSGEAHESAADHLRRLKDWTVTVTPTEGEPFDAALVDVIVADDGQCKAVFAKWDEEASVADPNDRVTLDIYDDIERVEVL